MTATLIVNRQDSYVIDSGEPGVADAGDVLSHKLTIGNTGTSAATGLTFSDTSKGQTLVDGTLNISPLANNDTYTAIGNTVLRVGTDSSINGGESTFVAGNLLSNDVNIAADQRPGFKIDALSGGVSAGGGKFNIFADGSFNYLNSGAVQTLATDSFTYTIRDAGLDGTFGNADDLTSTATVTINFAQQDGAAARVWYVDGSATTDGDGTSANPFRSSQIASKLNGASDVDAAGHVIYVENTVTGSLVLEASQKLIGTGEGLNVGGFQITADGSTNSALNATGGFAVTLNSNNTIAGVNLGGTGGIAGSGFGTLTVTDDVVVNTSGQALNLSTGTFAGTGFASVFSSGGGNNIALAQIDGTVNLGGGALSGATATGTSTGGSLRVSGGTATVNYSGTISQAAVDAPAVLINTGHNTGTVTLTGNITATNGSGLQFSDADGIYVLSGTNTLNGGNAGINVISGSSGTFTFGSGTSITSPTGIALNIADSTATVTFNGSITHATNIAALNVMNHAAGTISINGGVLQITNGTGLQFNNADGIYNINSVNGATILNGGDAGVDIVNGSSGTFVFGSNVQMSNTSGTTFNVNGGNGNITVNNAINDTNGQLVSITGRTGGTIDFNGRVTDGANAADGGGISVTGNSGGAVRFDGGVILQTISGINAFTATGNTGMTLVVANPLGTNSINATNGTALNVSNTTIGSEGLNFISISSTGGSATGIILDTTGSLGGLKVAGLDGADAGTAPDAGSGGTIANKTGADGSNATGVGIYLNSTANVSIAGMQLNDHQNFAIRGVNVTNFSLANSVINGANGTTSEVDEGSVSFSNLFGSSSVTDNNIGGGLEDNFKIFNTGGSLERIVFTGNTFGHNSTTLGNDSLLLQVAAGGTLKATISNNTFTGARGDLVQMASDGASVADIILTNNTLSNTHPGTAANGGGVTLAAVNSTGAASNFTYHVAGNTMTGAVGAGIAVLGSGGRSAGSIVNNTIGNPAIANSGSTQGSGIVVDNTLGGNHKVLISGNNIAQYNNYGVAVSAGNDQGMVGNHEFTITNNTIGFRGNSQPLWPTFRGIFANIGISSNSAQGSPDKAVATLHIQGNSVADAGSENITGADDIRVLTRFHTTTILPGYSGSSSDNAAAAAFLKSQNPTATTTSAQSSIPSGGGGFINGAVPTPPSAPPGSLMAAEPAVEPIAPEASPNETTAVGATADAPPPVQTYAQQSPQPTPTWSDPVAADSGAAAPAMPTGETSGTEVLVIDDGVLSAAELNLITEAAIQRWIDAGATAEQVSAMRAVNINVADLAGLQVGASAAGTITLDHDAAGWSWFIDSTPGADEEFGGSGTKLSATDATGPAGTRMDLLTVVMHELGHQIGLTDQYVAGEAEELMYGSIIAGERRLPGADDAPSAPAGTAPVAGALAIGPVSLGTLQPGQSITVEWRTSVDASPEDRLVQTVVNQATVDSDQTNAQTSSAQAQVTDGLRLGDRIFLDLDKNGLFDAGDSGIANVKLSLFADSNDNGLFDAADQAIVFEDVNANGVYDMGDNALPAGSTGANVVQLTATTDVSGLYSFAGLASGDYIVRVDASNFVAGATPGALAGRRNIAGGVDPDDNVDGDDNADTFDTNSDGAPDYVASKAIRLDFNKEGPAFDINGVEGNDTNNSLDIGFIQPNQAPTFAAAAAAPSYTENGPATQVVGSVTVGDVDSADYAGGSLTVAITSGGVSGDQLSLATSSTPGSGVEVAAGSVKVDNVMVGMLTSSATSLSIAFNAGATDAAVKAISEAIRISSTSENPTDAARIVTFTLVDGGGTADGGRDTTSFNRSVQFVGINDAPSGLGQVLVLAEDGSRALAPSDFRFSDVDGNSFAAVVISSLPTDGRLLLGGTVVTAGQVIAAADIAEGKLVFRPDANENGTGYASFAFQVRDNGGTVSGGQDTDQSPNFMSLDVTAVNDAPRVTVTSPATVQVGDETRVNSTTAGDQLEPAVAVLKGGDYVVTWTSPDSSSGEYGIFAQRYTAAGVPQGVETQVNSTTAFNQTASAIAALSDGGYVVTWTSIDEARDASGGIFAQRFDATGLAQGGEVRVNTTTLRSQRDAAVTALSDGGYVITWASADQDGAGSGIYAQRFDAAGVPQGGETRVNSTTANDQNDPDVAALNGGGYVVTWTSFQDGSGLGVYMQRYDAAGAALGGETRVNTVTSNNQFEPSVAALDGGGYVVTWTSAGQDGSGRGVYSQRYDGAGAPQGGETRVNTTTLSDQTAPSVSGLSGGGHVVTWLSLNQDGSGFGVFSQRFDAAGSPQGAETRVNSTTAGDQNEPVVAALNGGGYVVTWSSRDQDGSGLGVYSQRFSPALQATEQQAASLKGALGVVDVDAGAGVLTATLSVGYGRLNVSAGDSGATVAGGNGTATVTITGALAQINALLGSGGTSTVSFTPNTASPPASTALTLVVDDGGATGAGVALTGSAEAVILINSVNDAPTALDRTIETSEDDAYTFRSADFSFGDLDGHQFVAVVITAPPANGKLLLDGVELGANASVGIADIFQGRLKFMPEADKFGAPYTSFSFKVQDSGGTANGAVDLSGTKTITVNVVADNFAPVLDLDDAIGGSGFAGSYTEDAAGAATAANVAISDQEADQITGATVTVVDTVAGDTLSIGGTLPGAITASVETVNGAVVLTLSGAASADDYEAALELVRFSTTSQNPTDGGTDPSRTIATVVRDATGASLPATSTISIHAVNDAPLAAAAAESGSGNEDTTLSGQLLTGSDPDGDTALTYQLEPGAPAGLTLSAGGAWSWAPPADFDGSTSFSYRVSDGTLTSAAKTVSLTVDPVNDAPSGAAVTKSFIENQVYTFDDLDFGFTDLDGNALAAVKITSLPGAGIILLNGAAVAAGDLVGIADIEAGKLTYVPAVDAIGAPYSSFTFQVQDGGGTAEGGVNLDASPDVFTFNVAPDNRPPVMTPVTVANLAENASDAVAGVLVTALSASDPDGDAVGFLFANGTGTSGDFRILGNELRYFGAGLDFEFGPGTIPLSVVAQDSKGETSDAVAFDVAITNVLERLSSGGDDVIDFNRVGRGSFDPGTQYDTQSGMDDVILPDLATVAGGLPWDYLRTFDTSSGNDRIQGGDGNDRVDGGSGADQLWGRGGADRLASGGGNDILNGGAGNDLLSGNSGSDLFIFLSAEEIGTKLGLHDVITDFASGFDKIDLSAIYGTGPAAAGYALRTDGNRMETASAATAYDVSFYSVGGKTWVVGDVDGDGRADFGLELTGTVRLKAADLIVNQTGWNAHFAGFGQSAPSYAALHSDLLL